MSEKNRDQIDDLYEKARADRNRAKADPRPGAGEARTRALEAFLGSALG